MSEFITIKEASSLTGKKEMTIWRVINKLLKSDKESDKELVIEEKAPNTLKGFRYKIDGNYLRKLYNINVMEDDKESYGDVIEVEKKLLETKFENVILKERIKTKDTEKQRLEGQLKGLETKLEEEGKKLFEAGHQAGIFRGQANELRKLLEAPKKRAWEFWK